MQEDIFELLKFVNVLEGLKNIERWRGHVYWRDYEQRNRYESVADHSWRMAMMLVVLQKRLSQPINMQKALTMCLIHDIPEIEAGDDSPLGSDGTGKDSHAFNEKVKQERNRREEEAAKRIFLALPKEGGELYALWKEYEDQSSFEAKVVKALDKIEGKIQLLEYSKGVTYKEHLAFNLKYGIDTFTADPIIQELGDLVTSEIKNNFVEFKKD